MFSKFNDLKKLLKIHIANETFKELLDNLSLWPTKATSPMGGDQRAGNGFHARACPCSPYEETLMETGPPMGYI